MTLKDELQTDPLSRGYVAMTSDQLLASLMGLNRPVVVEHIITDRTLYAALGPIIAEGILQKLAAVAGSQPAVARALNWLQARDGFNIGDPYSQAMVDQLVTDSVFTAVEGTAVKGLAIVTKSRAEELGLALDWGVVNSARAALGWAV